MSIFRIATVFGVIFLSGCSLLSPKAQYIPENETLKPATLGVPYMAKVYIIGGNVIGAWYNQKADYTPGIVKPSDTGISLRNCLMEQENQESMLHKKPLYNGNCVEVYGTPRKAGKIKITLSGGMHGSMIAPANFYNKNYILNVVIP